MASRRLEKPGADFGYVHFQPDNYQDADQQQAMIRNVQAQIDHWRDKTNKPSQAGLIQIFTGLGMSQQQAQLTMQAAAGYLGLNT